MRVREFSLTGRFDRARPEVRSYSVSANNGTADISRSYKMDCNETQPPYFRDGETTRETRIEVGFNREDTPSPHTAMGLSDVADT